MTAFDDADIGYEDDDDTWGDGGYDDEPDYERDDDYEPLGYGEPDWDAVEYYRWSALSPLGRFRERASMRLRTWRWHWRDKRSAPPSDEPPPF